MSLVPGVKNRECGEIAAPFCLVLIRYDLSRPVLKITQNVLIGVDNFLFYWILQGLPKTEF
jgi:hypothetical protein